VFSRVTRVTEGFEIRETFAPKLAIAILVMDLARRVATPFTPIASALEDLLPLVPPFLAFEIFQIPKALGHCFHL